jgi:hypothetical protein
VYDDRRTIHQTVERAEPRFGRVDRGCDRRRLRQVHADGERVPPDCGRFERVRANFGQRDAGAFGGQKLGGCVTYAAGGAGNQDAPSHMSGRSGNFANRQWRVRWAGKKLADGIPSKGFRKRS